MSLSTISGPGIPTQKEAEKLFKRLIENEEQTISSSLFLAEQYDLALKWEQRSVAPDPTSVKAFREQAQKYRDKAEYRRAQIAQLTAIFNALPAGE